MIERHHVGAVWFKIYQWCGLLCLIQFNRFGRYKTASQSTSRASTRRRVTVTFCRGLHVRRRRPCRRRADAGRRWRKCGVPTLRKGIAAMALSTLRESCMWAGSAAIGRALFTELQKQLSTKMLSPLKGSAGANALLSDPLAPGLQNMIHSTTSQCLPLREQCTFYLTFQK